MVAHHRVDLWGLTFVLLGLVSGLGIYLGQGGVAGRAVDTGLGTVIGLVRLVAPVVFVVTGGLLMRSGRSNDDEDGGWTPMRAVLGLLLLLTSVTGLLHLATFRAEGDPVADLKRAGGGLGALASIRCGRGRHRGGHQPAGGAGHGRRARADGTTMRAVGQRLMVVGAPAGRLLVRSIEAVPHRAPRPPRQGSDDRGRDPCGHRGHDDRQDRSGAPGPEAAAESDPKDQPEDPERVRPGWCCRRHPEPGGRRRCLVRRCRHHHCHRSRRPGRQAAMGAAPARLLHRSGAQEVDQATVEETGRTLEHALAEHGVETRLVGMVVGPTVTRYELELGPGVKVARVAASSGTSRTPWPPPTCASWPHPRPQAIGVEVPNSRRQLVTVGDILASEESRRADHPLEVAVGQDIMGRSVLANLATMPHLLIAGATGAGKSSCINTLITSVLMRTTPDQVRLILVDPKRVELGQYNRLPHLLTQVVTNPKKAANALNWTVREMERRYDLLSEVGVRDIRGYNAAYDQGSLAGERSEVLRRALGHLPEERSTSASPACPTSWWWSTS